MLNLHYFCIFTQITTTPGSLLPATWPIPDIPIDEEEEDENDDDDDDNDGDNDNSITTTLSTSTTNPAPRPPSPRPSTKEHRLPYTSAQQHNPEVPLATIHYQQATSNTTANASVDLFEAFDIPTMQLKVFIGVGVTLGLLVYMAAMCFMAQILFHWVENLKRCLFLKYDKYKISPPVSKDDSEHTLFMTPETVGPSGLPLNRDVEALELSPPTPPPRRRSGKKD